MTDHPEYSWRQVRRSPSSKQRDPTLGEFFNSESLESMALKLTREAIGQNPLDAVDDETRAVLVRIFVSGEEDAVPTDVAKVAFAGLVPHVHRCEPRVRKEGLFERPCSFITVEDYNTTGLRGDVRQWDEPSSGVINDFFYFFRAEGKSGKSGDDRGRWGIGKYVFPMASRINGFFALSIRDGEDPGPLLMGQAILKNHTLDGDAYHPDSWWASWEMEDSLPVPVADGAVVGTFRETWNIQRQDDETGLSVVIPYVDEGLKIEDLARAILSEYYIAIISGRFEVILEGAGASGEILLDSDTIGDRVNQFFKGEESEDLLRQIDLALWLHGLDDDEFVTLSRQPEDQRPEWSDDLFDGVDRSELSSSLVDEKRIAIRVPVFVGRKEGKNEWSYFDVALEGVGDDRARTIFSREGLIILEAGPRSLRRVRALVSIEDKALAELVGDAENPAHTRWSSRTDQFVGKYVWGREWLAQVRYAPKKLLELIRHESDEPDDTLLSDLFPLPSNDGGPARSPRKKRRKTPPGPEAIPRGKPRTRVSRVDRGFSVGLTDDGRAVATTVDIDVAYDRLRGNPFNKWRPEDFDFSDGHLEIEHSGVEIEKCSGKSIRLRVRSPEDFRFSVRGFDTARDLKVRARAGNSE